MPFEESGGASDSWMSYSHRREIPKEKEELESPSWSDSSMQLSSLERTLCWSSKLQGEQVCGADGAVISSRIATCCLIQPGASPSL
uniref:Uncharacterized protein n=1 Tax=Ditylenchus dipsaci TaxID=166011 RepID=A0A915DNG8_9BILA